MLNKLIAVTKEKDSFDLIVIEAEGIKIKLNQEELNRLSQECDRHRTDNFRLMGYEIPKY